MMRLQLTKKAIWVVTTLGLIATGVVVYLRPAQKPLTVYTDTVSESPLQMTDSKLVVVEYIPLEMLEIPQSQKQELYQQITKLKRTGSVSGGVLTTEFKQATHAKMTYRFGRRQPLSFDMMTLDDKLPKEFILTGRQYEGKMGEQGFDGLYRLFEHPSSKARLEITETKINTTPLVLVRELFTEVIYRTPVRLESVTDKKGVPYHHAEFVWQDRYVSMTSKGMEMSQFRSLLEQILASQPAASSRYK